MNEKIVTPVAMVSLNMAKFSSIERNYLSEQLNAAMKTLDIVLKSKGVRLTFMNVRSEQFNPDGVVGEFWATFIDAS